MFNIGIGLALNGESEFKKGIRAVNDELKVLRSEAKLVKEQYEGNENSLEALTRKNELLERQLEQTNNKLELNKKQLEEWRGVHERAGSNVEELKRQLEKENDQLEIMKETSSATEEELKKQQDRIDELNQELKNAENAYEKAGQKITVYQTNVNNTQAQVERLDRELKQNGQYMEEASKSTDGCATSIDEYGKKVKEAGKQSEEFGEKSTQAVNDLAIMLQSAGIVAGIDKIKDALMDCSDAAGQFETATKKLSTIAEASGVPIDTLREQTLQASSDMAQSAANISEAAYNAISAGVDAENSVYAASQATELAIAGFTDTDAALSILTTSVNAYKLETEDMQKISDSLIVTQNLGVLTVDQMSQSMGKGIASASAYNVDLYNLESGYISLTKNGIAVAESTTYMSSMFKELGDSGSDVSKILNERTGYSFGQLMSQGYSLADVLQILYDSVNGDSEALMNLWSSAEAGKASNAIVSQGLENFNENLIAVKDSAGATEEAFEKMTDTTEFAEERVSIAAENLKIAIGTQLNESLKGVYDTGADILDCLTEFVNDNPEIVAAVTALVAGVGAATVGVIAWTVAQKALNDVLLQNPYALIAIGIIGVTSALGGYMAACEQQYGWATKIRDAENEKQEAIQNTLDTLQESSDARDASREAEEEEIELLQGLSGELVNLQKKEALSNEEKKKMSMLVTELNEAVPDLNLSLDEQGKVIGYTADELERYCELTLESLELQYKEEDLTEIAKEHYEAQKQLTEIQQNRIDLEEQLADMTEEYTQYVKDHEDEINYQDRTWTNAEGTAVKYKDAIKALEDEITDYNNQEKESIDLITDLEGQYAELTGEIMEHKDAYSQVSDAVKESQRLIIDYKGQHYEVTQGVMDNLESMSASYDDARDAAKESLEEQIGLFEELSIKSDLTAQQMADNLESQAEFYNQYTEDLKAAAQIMEEETDYATQAVLNQIIDMGVDGAGYLNELIEAYRSGGEEFSNVITSYMEMDEARNALAGAMADINTEYTKGQEELIESAIENGEAMRITTEEMSDAMYQGYAAGLDAMTTETENAMESINQTVVETQDAAGLSASALAQAMSTAFATTLQISEDGQSYMFKDQAGAITSGIAAGIEEGKDEIAAALQNAIDYSAKNMDIAGISGTVAGAINTALGQKMR